jgi:hypothetical protein
MLSKREAAERNILANGDYGVKCINCPFSDGYCTIQVTKSLGCKNACKQWLADNPEESEWKELKIDDLPGDILVGDYELQSYKSLIWKDRGCNITGKLDEAMEGYRFRYRKRQPEKKVPSHEEILSGKFWKFGDSWKKIVGYEAGIYRSSAGNGWTKKCFIDRESADIPPENAE